MSGLVAVTSRNRDAFIEWTRTHGAEHDGSYTQDADLAQFPTPGEIAVLAQRKGRPVGAASLIVDGFIDSGIARFRILHATHTADYGELVRWSVSRVPERVHEVFCFLPEQIPAARAVAALGFAPSRYAVILERAPAPVPRIDLPEGAEIRDATAEDAFAWANVVNAAFSGNPGRYDMTEQRAAQILCDERALGAFVLSEAGVPVGVSTVWRYEEAMTSSAEIVTLAVVPRSQQRGFGRALLRRALARADEDGLPSVSLSTSSTNRPALGLYTSEGFRVSETRVCWSLALSANH